MKAFSASLAALLLLWVGYHHWHAPITYPPGVLLAAEPSQRELLSTETDSIAHGNFQLQPLAGFSLEARVLHRKNYHFDTSARLAPTDLALGWGRMSDQAVLDQLEISQSMRFYWYEYQNSPPIPKDEIIRHSSNMHIIPATGEIERECGSLREGELVRLEGELVEATGEGIRPWRSSLRRDDSGNGACELFFVQRFSRIAR